MLHEYFADVEPSSRVLVEYLYIATFLALNPCARVLPDQPIVGTELIANQMINRIVVFILRGLGFKDGAIKRLLQPDKTLTGLRRKYPL